jgi:cellulose synthase/poly-beta-1,6-N-acetylglucosamine synthase-like glycosyltransferase
MAILFLLLVMLSAGYLLLIGIYTYGWRQIRCFVPGNHHPATPVSVVIVARNEAKNIRACLLSVLNQNYPRHLFEVIVADDHSEDNTFEIAQQLQQEFDNLSVYRYTDKSSAKTSFKKEAITKAVSSAKGTLIVTTDADCVAGSNWVKTITAYYESYSPKMMVMPVRFDNDTSFLGMFQQMDLSGLMGITAGSLYLNFPLMANGANMAFEKSAFMAVNGFSGNENIPGGDDIYLLLKIKKKFHNSVHFLKSKDVIVTTLPVSTFRQFYHQRIRWISKAGKFGDWKITAVLVWSYLFNLILLIGVIMSIFLKSWLLFNVSVAIYLLRWVAECILVKNVSVFLNHSFSVVRFILSTLIHQIYVLVFGVLALLGKYEWKGRHYR